MYNKNKENILLHIFVAFILSSISYLLIYKNKWLAIIIVSCFFVYYIFMSITEKRYFYLLLSLFFIIPIINNSIYYNIKFENEEVVRILKTYGYGGLGEIEGRKVYLSGDIGNVSVGSEIQAIGEFVYDANIEKGTVGDYNVKSIEIMPLDLKGRLFKVREDIFNKIKDKIGERRAALVTSIAFGYDEFLDKEDEDVMKNLGVLHAISVSGLHMALVYSLLKKLLGEKTAILVSIFYVLFTGAAASTVRSYIMLLILSLAPRFKRNYNPIASLSLAGIILIIYKPYSIFEVGFQLSFLATLGIIIFNKDLNKKLYKLPKAIREGSAISLSAQVFTIPFMILYFREFSIGFLLGNLILIPLINVIVILGNVIVLFYKLPVVFNYLSFLLYYLTLGIDYLSEKLLVFLPKSFYLNDLMAVAYIILMISAYFYNKGYKRAIYFNLIFIVYLVVNIYSPIPKIEYYKEGVVTISYKGEKEIFLLKKGVNIEKYKKISLSNNVNKDFNIINLKGRGKIYRDKNNLILNYNNKEYLINLSKGKIESNYDIIDCKYSSYSKIILFNNDVLVFN